MDRKQFLERVDAYRREGKSIREIAAELGTYKSKIQRALKTLAELSSAAVHTSNLIAGSFVGRQREMDELLSAFDDAASGNARIVTLSGEPGIGKTRLVQEIALVAKGRDAKVLWAAATKGRALLLTGPGCRLSATTFESETRISYA